MCGVEAIAHSEEVEIDSRHPGLGLLKSDCGYRKVGKPGQKQKRLPFVFNVRSWPPFLPNAPFLVFFCCLEIMSPRQTGNREWPEGPGTYTGSSPLSWVQSVAAQLASGDGPRPGIRSPEPPGQRPTPSPRASGTALTV